MPFTFTVPPGTTEIALVEFLRQQIPAAPIAYLRQLAKKSRIKDDQGPLDTNALLLAGQRVYLPQTQRLTELISQSKRLAAEIDILLETPQLLIINKPAGLAVHGSEGHETDNLTHQLQQQLHKRGEKYRIAPVQRLDLGTSGTILFGKGRKALAELGQMMMARQLRKEYLALIASPYKGEELLCSRVQAKGKEKEARMQIKTIGGNAKASLLQIELLTGRQHQIRQQLAQLGQPVWGDHRYGGPRHSDLPRIFLHSWKLTFHSPWGGELISATAPLPQELSSFLHKMGLSTPGDS